MRSIHHPTNGNKLEVWLLGVQQVSTNPELRHFRWASSLLQSEHEAASWTIMRFQWWLCLLRSANNHPQAKTVKVHFTNVTRFYLKAERPETTRCSHLYRQIPQNEESYLRTTINANVCAEKK